LAGHQGDVRISSRLLELACFRLDEDIALDKVDQPGAARAAVQGLSLGSFAAWSRLRRARLNGRWS